MRRSAELQAPDGHLVPGQGAGLVRADDGGRAERLDGGQPADEGAHAGHALHAQRQRHGGDGGQPLGHGRDGQRDADLQHVQEGVAPQPARQDDDRAERQDDADQGVAELGQLPLQRGVAGAGLLDQRADPAHLGAHAGGGDEEPAAAVGDGRAQVDHVPPVAERRVRRRGSGRRSWLTGERLAGQRRLLHLQPHALDDPAVGGHARPGGEDDDVAGHQLGRGDLVLLPVADDVGRRHRLLLQGGQGLLGLPLGQEADGGVQDDDDQDGDRLDRLAQREGHRRWPRPAGPR